MTNLISFDCNRVKYRLPTVHVYYYEWIREFIAGRFDISWDPGSGSPAIESAGHQPCPHEIRYLRGTGPDQRENIFLPSGQ